MYQSSYQEIRNDGSQAERENESVAFDKALELLYAAQEHGVGSMQAIEAQFFVHRLWVFFIEDLTKKENGFDDILKADIISVGIWVLQEIERLRQGQSKDFKNLIEVSKMLKQGLS